ncbi:MAG: dipeptidase [Promethearchaeota archaeon]|jgi:membrane dipeptidase
MVIVDAHSDYALHVYREHLKGKKSVLKEQHLPFLRSSGVKLELLTVGGDFELFPEFDSQDYKTILKIIDSVKNEISENPDLFYLIKNSKDFEKIRNSNRIGYILALEGSNSIGSNLSLLHNYYELGVRSIALTHNSRNLLADGCAEKPAKGLSSLGKKYIEELNDLNIIVDLSHISEPSFWDVLKILKKPPIATHSNAKALCNHPRNLTDDQIKVIAKRNGVIGVNFFSTFVDKNKATIERLIDHIDYIVKLTGIDHVGIGPDFLNYYIKDLKSLDEQISDPFGDLDDYENVFEVIKDPSEFPKLFDMIRKRGYTESEFKKILGENFIRVFREILK